MVNAEKWLADYLKDGKPHEIKEIRRSARFVGLLKADLKEARKAIGVQTINKTFPDTGETVWYWRLK